MILSLSYFASKFQLIPQVGMFSTFNSFSVPLLISEKCESHVPSDFFLGPQVMHVLGITLVIPKTGMVYPFITMILRSALTY